MTGINVFGSLSFACIVMILLVLKDIQTELRTIRRELNARRVNDGQKRI